jgi:hypothetical protein
VRNRRTLLLVLLATVAASCVGGPGATPDRRTDREREIDAHAAIWAGHELRSYTFTISRPCFCPPEASGPFVVTVTDGQVTSVTLNGLAVRGADATGSIPFTIDQAFLLLRGLDPSAQLTVTWDPDLGYPVEASIDPIANAIDDEYGLSITELTPAE